jgi:hypothetical protein
MVETLRLLLDDGDYVGFAVADDDFALLEMDDLWDQSMLNAVINPNAIKMRPIVIGNQTRIINKAPITLHSVKAPRLVKLMLKTGASHVTHM